MDDWYLSTPTFTILYYKSKDARSPLGIVCLCYSPPKARTGFLKVSLAKWQNPCYNVYVSFRIAAEQLQ